MFEANTCSVGTSLVASRTWHAFSKSGQQGDASAAAIRSGLLLRFPWGDRFANGPTGPPTDWFFQCQESASWSPNLLGTPIAAGLKCWATCKRLSQSNERLCIKSPCEVCRLFSRAAVVCLLHAGATGETPKKPTVDDGRLCQLCEALTERHYKKGSAAASYGTTAPEVSPAAAV